VATEQLVLVSTGARDWLESNGSMRAVEGGYRVSARKAFASGSPAGDVAITTAPYEDPALGWQVLHFAVQSALIVARALHERVVALANDLDFTPSLELSNEIVVLKTQIVESAHRVVERAIEAVGGPGYYRRTGLERLLRDVRAGHFHPFPAKQQYQFTGRLALGLPPIKAWSAPEPAPALALAQ